MRISRIDLDGKGMGSPEGLASAIFKIESNLPIPVPIEQLCLQLDIAKIAALETEGFEGGLLTDSSRSSGVILVKQASSRQRRRFTIGHELGHFLIPTHMPSADGQFLCSQADMRRLSAKENDRRERMEVEANRFSSLILIPPPKLRPLLAAQRNADLVHMVSLAEHFDVSKEAMARSYSLYNEETIAVVVCKDAKIRRHYCDRIRFPYLQAAYGGPIPRGSLFHRSKGVAGTATAHEECTPDEWINVEFGKTAPSLTEQVYFQRDGFALILLKLEIPSEEDLEDEEIERSWRVGFKK